MRIMPSRNVIKQYVAHSYYHIYNRGVAKHPIFIDEQDKNYFLKIIERHLDPNNTAMKADGLTYRKFDKDLTLLCYCLMGNHFHMLCYVYEDARALSLFMQSLLTAYTMYFNKRYKRVGTLFQGVYKASLICEESYLLHISRYIHLNPRRYKTYRHSSLAFYTGTPPPVWINPQQILDLDDFTAKGYLEFLEDYEDHKLMLDEIKNEMAAYDY